MKKRDPLIYLEDILDSTKLLKTYLKGCDQRQFKANKLILDAVYRRLAIIGEAVKYVPTEIRRAYPEISWKNISGMRNILIHEYFNVDPAIAWKTCEVEIPKLERVVKKIIQEIKKR